MKTKVILTMIAAGIAFTLGSCSTGKQATQTAFNDDVYNSEVKAKALVFTPRPETQSGSEYSTDDYYEDQYSSRLNIDNRNSYTWRDYYYNNNLAYDPFFDPSFNVGFNNWYRPGLSFNLGWNNWGWNSWNLGWNNWGWNNWGWNSWGYNPWYSPYASPYWGIYSYNNPYWGGGYWGNGYYGGIYPGGVGVISRPNNPRPVRGSEGVRTNTNPNGSASRIPRPTYSTDGSNSRPSTVSGRPDRGSVNPNSSGTQRPASSGTQSSRPARTETQSRPSRTESTESSRPTRVERPAPVYTPQPSSSGGSSRGSYGGGSSGGGGSSRPSR